MNTENSINTKTDYELVLDTLKNIENYKYIIHRYEKRLIIYIRGLILCNKEDAEDILQEVFINTYKNLNNYNPDFKFSSWIYRITHNEAINFIRKSNKKLSSSTSEFDEKIFDVISDDIKLEDEIINKIDNNEIKLALNSMDSKYRDVLILRYYEDYEYEEISDILRISKGTVGSLINRAKFILKGLLNHGKN